MRYVKWLKIFFIINVFSLLVVVGTNFIVDPYYIFHTNILKKQNQINERFNKIKFLKKNYYKFNSYMFGSSRIATTEPSIIEKYVKSSKFYNMTVASATQYDNLLMLKYMIQDNMSIENVYLQIDLSENFTQFTPDASDYMKKHYPKTNIMMYYLEYLTIIPSVTWYNKIILNLKNVGEETIFDTLNTGCWYKKDKDKLIEEDHEGYIKNIKSLNINKVHRTLKENKLHENMVALKDFVNLCNKRDINLIVFITPHNYNLFNRIDIHDYERFLKEIANITPYWDFSGYNSVTLDNHFYYEESHYLSVVGKMIAAKIFNDKEVQVPSDFGHYITSENVDQYIEISRKTIRERELK